MCVLVVGMTGDFAETRVDAAQGLQGTLLPRRQPHLGDAFGSGGAAWNRQ